jgi:hypothetical protein
MRHLREFGLSVCMLLLAAPCICALDDAPDWFSKPSFQCQVPKQWTQEVGKTAFMKWLSADPDFFSALELVWKPGSVRPLLVSAVEIQGFAPVAFVPPGLHFHVPTGTETDSHIPLVWQQLRGLRETVLYEDLILWLLHEFGRLASSWWQPFLEVLPPPHEFADHPLYWDRARLYDYADARFSRRVVQFQEEVRSAWTVVQKTIAEPLVAGNLLPTLTAHCLTQDLYTWAFLVVTTRAFTLVSGRLVLIPFLDILDHDGRVGLLVEEVKWTQATPAQHSEAFNSEQLEWIQGLSAQHSVTFDSVDSESLGHKAKEHTSGRRNLDESQQFTAVSLFNSWEPIAITSPVYSRYTEGEFDLDYQVNYGMPAH